METLKDYLNKYFKGEMQIEISAEIILDNNENIFKNVFEGTVKELMENDSELSEYLNCNTDFITFELDAGYCLLVEICCTQQQLRNGNY